MVLKQIECPPEGSNKYSMSLFVNKWLPAMEKYAVDYVGLGDITGSTSNKSAKKVAIGTNKFVPIAGQCGSSSDIDCIGQDRYMYLRTYPLGYIPKCVKSGNEYKNEENIDIVGGTGLLGGIQEDLYNLEISDAMASTFKKGPFASSDCMKARLPVGDGLLLDGRKFSTSDEVKQNGRGWYIEEKCVPRQPTFSKNYGGETFEIPISESRCVKEGFQDNRFRTKGSLKKKIGLDTYLLIAISCLIVSFISIRR